MSDYRDTRGAYDHVNDFGNPQPPEVWDKLNAHQKAQWGADVRPDPLPGPCEGYPLPEGIRKERMRPLNKDTQRRPKRITRMWTANARLRATLAGLNNAAALLGELSAAKRKKKLGKNALKKERALASTWI
jgi:hypothetical protein